MTVAVQLCSLIIPFIVRYSVDNITNISLPKLLAFGVSTLCLYGLLSYIRNNIFLKVSFGFWERLSKKVVGKLFEAKLSFFDTRASGDLLSRVNNIATIKDMIVKILNSAVIDGLSVIIFGTVMFVLSPGLLFIVLIIALVQMIFFGFCMKKMQRLINKLSSAKLRVKLKDSCRYMKHIKTAKKLRSNVFIWKQWKRY